MKIGFFDSGLGGLTILKEAMSELNADYIYLGDTKNTPYGTKDKEKVKEYVFNNVEILAKEGCKIIVIACNTATSIAIEELRQKYKEIIIIGIEPALKTASIASNSKNILLCATTITVNSNRVKTLISKLGITKRTTLLALDKLVTFAESKEKDIKAVKEYLNEELIKYDLSKYSHIVLGCTHFPLFIEEFREILPSNINIIDNTKGIVNNLKRKAQEIGYTNKDNITLKLMITKENDIFVTNVKNILKLNDINVEVK